jgi:hypothetical protein
MTLYLVFCHNHGNFSKMQVYFPDLFQFNQKFLHLFFPLYFLWQTSTFIYFYTKKLNVVINIQPFLILNLNFYNVIEIND